MVECQTMSNSKPWGVNNDTGAIPLLQLESWDSLVALMCCMAAGTSQEEDGNWNG